MKLGNRVSRAARKGPLVGMALIGFVAVAHAVPAAAIVVEDVSIENFYGYTPGSAAGTGSQMGTNREQYFIPSSGNGPSELGIDYTAFANNEDGFFFLHQNYCIGTCSTYSNTTITFMLTNNSDAAVNLRFDSLITPGHLSLLDPNRSTAGSFEFYVAQSSGEASRRLYEATGTISPNGLELDTGALTFSDLAMTTVPGSGAQIIDWGATVLSVPLLSIDANSTSFLTYSATYSIQNNGVCIALTNCSSAEVVFGDPRNNGGVSSRAALADVKPQVGGRYYQFFVPFSIVDINAAPPPAAPPKTQVSYLPFNQSNAGMVPEPASWAMMILGLAAVGTVMRRQRSTALSS